MKKIIIKMFLAAAAAVLFGCASAEKAPAPFTAATFNIKNSPEPEVNAWDLRRDSVAKLIKKHGFDIFGTQEGHFHQLDDISARTGFKYVGKGREDGRKAGRLPPYSTIPRASSCSTRATSGLQPTPDKPVKGWDAACRRICSWGKFRDLKTGKKFAFFSLHFDHKGKRARAESARLLVKKVSEISGNLPFLCVGDFNATPDSEPMKIIFAEKSFKDSLSVLRGAPKSAGGTFHNFTGKAETRQDRTTYLYPTESTSWTTPL